ncbi:anoctamin-1-like isoform X1 [Penaeus chinensis]|uniref:anoctamin-1-like isoform X1 n=1 Tax=Penaeus chinensis TaxID=139456 RepID=UPI001FB7EBCA|nr:anoctamin-1-like isoform X1 [Penaeus chinensis]XP_047493991.1 anoctamin-1-like isoform X1 [Penaeus chinensis]
MSTSGGDSEYSTPLQSHRASRQLASPTSYTSVYYSTTELHDPGESSDMDAELIADHHDIAMDDLNGQPLNDTRKTPLHPDLFMEDGVSSIDYVLVSKEIETEDQADNEERRETFENNLRKEGLTLEVDRVEDVPLRFVKIHAPFEVCTRYAEILKLRMPMREKLDAEFHDHRVVLHFPGLPALEFTPPAVFQDMTDCVSKIFNFVRLDRNVFPPKNRHFTAVYSRDKEYLFDVTEEFFTAAVRARIIDFILRRKKFNDSEDDDFAFGIEKMLSESTYEAAYPIHEGDLHVEGNDRSLLFKNWAALRNFYKYQPLDYIKDYFGVKIGLYFAWLGFYTYMLIPASIVGLLCFIYAVSTINNHMPSKDICNKSMNIHMCPLCDKFCDFWKLDGFCFHAKFTYLVDNPSTIFFTAFMSLWAALFLEMWKRYSAEITHRWDLTGFDIQEEHPRPQYLARLAHIKKKTVNIVTKTVEPKPPFWKMRFPGIMISLSSVVLLVLMALVAVIAVILYRMAVLAALAIHGDSVITSYAIIFTSTTAAFINLICIMIFNQVYARVAERLTELELQRTQTEFDDSLTLKIYMLQFINYYSSIFYIAFFKGKMVGYPGKYNRIFGSRQEECSPGGCLLELSVQLAIIMVGKQAMNTCMEMVIPMLWKWYNMLTVPENQREAHSRWPRWAKDFRLVNFDPRGLFPEYLEMVLQYGFVTIFVSSFPLAPLFAFLNNIFEMRLDAKKLLTHFRRPISQRVKDIGIWFKILDSIGKLAVITNAFIIAFTSNFIPELVYRHVVSETGSLDGFLNHSLATFNVSDYPPNYKVNDTRGIEQCRYPDYRNPPGTANSYDYAPIFWHILAARLAFVVVFENVVCVIILFIKWIIPDMPYRLQEQIRREAYVTNELIVEQELRRAREANTTASSSPRSPLRRQYSEPARNRNVQDVRFRIDRGFLIEVSRR